ncbi:MAG: hypothetical protein F4Y94_04115, partial [Chloroflexi bacterium]|nr:hypothetical protein [Chloroflexota bacterium]
MTDPDAPTNLTASALRQASTSEATADDLTEDAATLRQLAEDLRGKFDGDTPAIAEAWAELAAGLDDLAAAGEMQVAANRRIAAGWT